MLKTSPPKSVKFSDDAFYRDRVRVGNFSTMSARPDKEGNHKASYFDYCREWFHKRRWGDYILFCTGSTYAERVVDFMTVAEHKLHLKQRSEFGQTSRRAVIWCKPSSWWLKDRMRRSLFTILLRAGLNYESHHWQKALFSVCYTKETSYAVNRFFSGHNKFVGNGGGWVRRFRQKDTESVENYRRRVNSLLR